MKACSSRTLWNWFCCRNKCCVHLPDSINRSNCTATPGAQSQTGHAIMDSERRVKVKVSVFYFCFCLSLYSCESKLNDLLLLIPLLFFFLYNMVEIELLGFLFLFVYCLKGARFSDQESCGREGHGTKCWLVDGNPCHNFSTLTLHAGSLEDHWRRIFLVL